MPPDYGQTGPVRLRGARGTTVRGAARKRGKRLVGFVCRGPLPDLGDGHRLGEVAYRAGQRQGSKMMVDATIPPPADEKARSMFERIRPHNPQLKLEDFAAASSLRWGTVRFGVEARERAPPKPAHVRTPRGRVRGRFPG